jgi:hypothetical protein
VSATPHIVLSSLELAEITGRKRKGDQIAWLRDNGWRFVVRADGHPAVAYAEMEAKMMSRGKVVREIGPNLAALDRFG